MLFSIAVAGAAGIGTLALAFPSERPLGAKTELRRDTPSAGAPELVPISHSPAPARARSADATTTQRREAALTEPSDTTGQRDGAAAADNTAKAQSVARVDPKSNDTSPVQTFEEPKSVKRPLPRVSSLAALRHNLDAKGFKLGSPAFIRIFKQSSELEVWMSNSAVREAGGDPRFKLYKTFRICRWSGKIGPKLAEGDHQSPEGFYTIRRWQLRPWSRNHRAIEVGFPNAFDRAHGRTGSHIQIHGGCGSEGCFAMTDRGIEEIYDILEASLESGQAAVPLHIFPFRMSEAQLSAKKGHEWHGFWASLKPMHDAFPKTPSVPKISVCGKRYHLGPQPEKCVAPAHGTKKLYFAKTPAGKKASGPAIKVKCNISLPSCKRWLALAKRRLARGGKLHPTAADRLRVSRRATRSRRRTR